MFHGLREQVDAVLVGTGTLRAEKYGRLLGKPERRQRRVDRGQAPEPLLVTVSRSGDIPTDIPLFAEPEARIIVFSAATPDMAGCAAQVEVVQRSIPAELTFTTVMRPPSKPPRRPHAAVRGWTDAVRLAPAGGPRGRAVSDAGAKARPAGVAARRSRAARSSPSPAQARIAWLLEREGDSLYLRYALH